MPIFVLLFAASIKDSQLPCLIFDIDGTPVSYEARLRNCEIPALQWKVDRDHIIVCLEHDN
jgi:hypothetical protein